LGKEAPKWVKRPRINKESWVCLRGKVKEGKNTCASLLQRGGRSDVAPRKMEASHRYQPPSLLDGKLPGVRGGGGVG